MGTVVCLCLLVIALRGLDWWSYFAAYDLVVLLGFVVCLGVGFLVLYGLSLRVKFVLGFGICLLLVVWFIDWSLWFVWFAFVSLIDYCGFLYLFMVILFALF